jgi:DNA ligase-associated metallophosphoesterase
MPATCTIDFHGEELILHPEGAIWWPAKRSLLLSDLHLGKSAAFRARGLPVPEGDNTQDLRRIDSLVAEFGTETLLVLGDFLHSNSKLTPELAAELNVWLQQLPCEVVLIRGNHDPSPSDLKAVPRLKTLDRLQLGSILLIHNPAHAPDRKPSIAGHLHPLCRIGRKEGPKRRVPCFYQTSHTLVLPAFGTFTSGTVVEPKRPNELCHVIAGDRVLPLSPTR